jgi:hypothetical protein
MNGYLFVQDESKLSYIKKRHGIWLNGALVYYQLSVTHPFSVDQTQELLSLHQGSMVLGTV